MSGRATRGASVFRPAGAGDLVAVADAHLTDDDPGVAEFCRFLEESAAGAAGVVLLGDIFSLWLGARKLARPCHRAVLDAVARIRRQGVPVAFVEGNRELGVSRAWADAFDAASVHGLLAEHAGRRWFFTHGDRARPESVPDQVFRLFVRSRAVQSIAFALPVAAGLALGERIERALRGRNLRRKSSIREADLLRFGRRLAMEAVDAVAIGHLHVELLVDGGRDAALVVVLPDWRSGRRFLRVPAHGDPRIETWGDGGARHPAIVEVVERDGEAEIVLDAPTAPRAGTRVVVSSGHGPDVRRGTVVRAGGPAPGGRARIRVRLEAGPPLQAGDRVEGAGGETEP